MVSDFGTFAYLADVFILEEYRGKGLSKWLMSEIINHPELTGLRRIMLATRDAHGLYAQFGFKKLEFPDRYMEVYYPNAHLK
jgi:GNAT superfamily N-acetyltransferase